jgi:hypothetical protein
MKRILFLVACSCLLGAGLLESETLYLKDGSTLNGRFVRMAQDTVYFETSFGALMRVHKGQVSRIDFVEGMAPAVPSAGTSIHVSAEPGTLEVSFEKFELTSRISVERDRDRKGHEKENAIEEALLLGGTKVYSLVDSTTDKIVREGPETILRNDMKPRDFKVALGPGLHSGLLVIGNSRISVYTERFDPAPLDKKLILENVDIKTGETTQIRVGLKRRSWRGGKSELFRVN